MPEGPEIRIITEQLNSVMVGKILRQILPVGFPEFSADLDKHLTPLLRKNKIIKIQRIGCKGKFIYIELGLYDGAELKARRFIGNHLGYTGHWLLREGKYTRLQLQCTDMVLFFDDQLRLGKFFWFCKNELLQHLQAIGSDILSPDFTKDVFVHKIQQKEYQNQMIGELLHDQHFISGIGNYLRAEILYDSRIHPRTKVKDLSQEQLSGLYDSIRRVSTLAYSQGGSKSRTYKNLYGETGSFDFKVYKQTKDLLGNPVKAEKLGSQTMYFVPLLQKK